MLTSVKPLNTLTFGAIITVKIKYIQIVGIVVAAVYFVFIAFLYIAEPRSLVKDLPRREAELAARNTPARVPCVELRTRTLGFNGIQDTGIMTDPLCALNGWINGFGGLPP